MDSPCPSDKVQEEDDIDSGQMRQVLNYIETLINYQDGLTTIYLPMGFCNTVHWYNYIRFFKSCLSLDQY